MIRHLNLKAYGKVNLGLDVLRRRDDGYHEVRMVMQTVGLYDKVELLYREEPGVTIETNLYYLPANENNLACRAAALLLDEFGVRHGVHIRLNKFIPVAAGMAGGSSDAAAVLYGVSRMFGLGLSREQLQERGLRIGADVPYCVLRGTALSEGVGEILTPLPPAPQCQVLIAKPGISVSTRSVYENLHADRLRPDPPEGYRGDDSPDGKCSGDGDRTGAPGDCRHQGYDAGERSGRSPYERQRSHGVWPVYGFQGGIVSL